MQNNTFEYFMHLLYLRNEVNKKRRRFLLNSYTFKPNPWKYTDGREVIKPVKHLSFAECRNGYNKARQEIKSYKKQILKLKKLLGVKAYQNDCGAYVKVYRGDDTFTSNDFKRFHLMLLAEKHLLGAE